MKSLVQIVLYTLSGAVICFGLAYFVSSLFGPEAAFACLLAILVSILSGAAWLFAMLKACQKFGDLLEVSLSGGPWIRLRTTVIGSIICGIIIEGELVWFLGWTSMFYILIMAVETALVIWILKNYNLDRKFF